MKGGDEHGVMCHRMSACLPGNNFSFYYEIKGV